MSQAPDITGTEGERLDATVTVDSTFSSQQTQTIELRVEDINTGTTVHTDSQQVTLADSTDSQQITLSWPTSDGDKGVYDLFIESDQDTIQRLVEVTTFDIATVADNHWIFDEGSGLVAADSAGSFDADFGSAISWGSGEGKGGVYGILDGSGGADLGSGSASHWSHWVNSGLGGLGVWLEPDFAAQPDFFAGVVTTDVATGGTEREINLDISDGGRLRFQMQDSSNTKTTVSANVVSDTTWQAAAVRGTGTELRLYHATVNDSTLSQVDSATINATESGDLQRNIHIGKNPAGGEPDRQYAGGIDDLWSDQSDPGEQAIKDWYNATKGNYP